MDEKESAVGEADQARPVESGWRWLREVGALAGNFALHHRVLYTNR